MAEGRPRPVEPQPIRYIVVSRNNPLQCAQDRVLLCWYVTLPVPVKLALTRRRSAAVVPLTAVDPDTVGTGDGSTDVPFHPKYQGSILFKNKFDGELPATDYPKVNFYLAMLLAYALFASAWGWLCYQHVQDLLPIQVCGACGYSSFAISF